MARRRGPRDSRMGVGGMAGDLGYGERGMVESTAMSPMSAGQTGGPQGMMGGMQGPPNLGMAVEPFAPSDNPGQPITAGLEPDAMMSPDPADVLRAMYRRFPYPDLRRLLERAQMTDYNAMARQEAEAPMQMGSMPQSPDSPMADSWMRDDEMRGQIEGFDSDQTFGITQGEAEDRLGGIRENQGGSRFDAPAEMTRGQQADADRLQGQADRFAQTTSNVLVDGTGVLDQIVDGENAVVLVGEDETELVVNVGLLPEEAQEGDVIVMEFFLNEELTEARRSDPSAMSDEADADNAAVLDRIVDGEFATLLVGPTETEIIVNIGLLPDEAQEGDWLQIGFVVDTNATEMRRGSAEDALGEIRNRQGDSRFEGTDPDRSVMSPDEQADVERRMDGIRRDRTGGRF